MSASYRNLRSMRLESPSVEATQCSLLIGIVGIAAITRLWGIAFGIPYSDARPDETTMVQISLGLLFGGLNPRFFHWPSLEFYLLAAIYRVAFEIGHLRGMFQLKFDMFRHAISHPGWYLLVPRAVSAIAGVLTVWLVYRITRKLFDGATALVAAFFVSIAYLHVRESHFGVTDVAMTCLAISALFPLSRVVMTPGRLRSWAMGGVLVGLAASTKYNGSIMIAVGLGVAMMVKRPNGESWPGRTGTNGAAIFVLCTILAFVAGTPFAVLDFGRFVDGLRFDSDHFATGHGIVLGRGWFYHLAFTLRHGLGMPLFMCALIGMVILATRRWRKAVFICTFPVLYFALLGAGYTVFVRYMVPVVPFLCISAAVTVVVVTRRIIGRSVNAQGVSMAAVALIVAMPSIQRVIGFDHLLTKADTRLLAAQWLDQRLDPSSWVAEAPEGLIYPLWGRPAVVQTAHFDVARLQFVADNGETVQPEWIALATSPLSVYTTVPNALTSIVRSTYAPVARFSATTDYESPALFDQQDKFFLPFVEFTARIRPGPEIDIYRRSPSRPR